ncbi:MAG: hypothetical protein UY32_C0028G0010 [Candidatus Jorgensenbacteria bacterium GW2011_GWC1_48_8]|uniref:Uncharacterized protein n=1 Tax=Candidatus Jorgensenbacteria bacterium GW2011_GWC1_48_8 TaxID=1618666 RepID=A0A0G1UWB4_9BACT|nr:MAG: hypothetical protein UY32_C0028G0010 [Candidatus Jorgensenbacteria bacterium GW2011_GWC1_48_8]
MNKFYYGLILIGLTAFAAFTYLPSLHGSGNALVFDKQTLRFYVQPYSYSESITHRLIGGGYCSIHWGVRHNLTGLADMYLYPNGPSTAFPTPTDNITAFPQSLINNCDSNAT